ncbi:MAG: ribosome small subunit-dependent GTPase A [Clostridia bacterium]|nr:ribosome small subunit-dependent GTPase A [Clostridia bacterium]
MQGRIINNISNTYIIEADKCTYEAVIRGKMKLEDMVPVVGDNVEFEEIPNQIKQGIITKILPRKNYIKRPKIANVTRLILVVSIQLPKPDLLLLDKQLAFAEFMKMEPIIILNKQDLGSIEEIQNIQKIYQQIGYHILVTSAKQQEGIEQVREALKGQTSAFSGNSGVGKSTLLNAIFERDLTMEGVISKKNQKGKNTTTTVQLYQLDEETYIADTPGFSTFDIYEIESKNLYMYFKELRLAEKDCKYVGCTHIKENECGIKRALEEGKIALSRYQNYVKIYENIKDKEEHKW